MVSMKRKTANQMTFLFFKKRFPEKIRNGEVWDKGYYDEWKRRMESGHPEVWCDSKSLKIIQGFRKNGYVW